MQAVHSNPRLLYVLAEDSGAAADYSACEKAASRSASSPGNANRELALYLAGKGGDPAKAVQVARKEAERKGDVHTNDALAVALFANGEIDEARRLMKAGLAVGTQDPEILAHASKLAVKVD